MGLLTLLLIFLFVGALVYVLVRWAPAMDPFVRMAVFVLVVFVLLYVILSLLGLAPALTR